MNHKHYRRTLKDSIKEIEEYGDYSSDAEKIHNIHHKHGGSTYNLKSGVIGGDLWAVSPYIEKSFIKNENINKNDINQFINKNKDLLLKPDHHVGTWKAGDGKEYIDVSVTTHDKDKAIDIAKKANQRAIYNLLTGEEHQIGGTGEVLKKDLLQKDVGRITMPKLDPKLTRPDQEVSDVNLKTKSIQPLIAVNKIENFLGKKLNTHQKEAFLNTFGFMTKNSEKSPKHGYSVYQELPGGTERPLTTFKNPKAKPYIKEHEGLHLLVSHISYNHNIPSDSIYHKLNGFISKKTKDLLSSALAKYRGHKKKQHREFATSLRDALVDKDWRDKVLSSLPENERRAAHTRMKADWINLRDGSKNLALQHFQQDLNQKYKKDIAKSNIKIGVDSVNKKDIISGGLADKKQPKDFDSKSLANGIKVEMEHTKDPKIAQEIAMDHLTEDPNYYTKLKEMEMKKSLAKKMQRLKKTLLAQGLGPRVPAPMETGGIDPVVMATDVE